MSEATKEMSINEIIKYLEEKSMIGHLGMAGHEVVVNKNVLRRAAEELKTLHETETNRRKLNILNQLEVTDWDCDSDSVIYVMVENSEHNRAILKSIGATEDDFKEMGEDDDLDITTFAFSRCKADFYKHGTGFGID